MHQFFSRRISPQKGKCIIWIEGKGEKPMMRQQGDPACSLKIKKYWKVIQQEQALAKSQIKQGKLFNTLRTIAGLIDWQLYSTGNSLDTRYILLRDQAFFKVKSVWADSARDLGRCVAQEMKITRNDEGLLFTHTVGKTLSNDN